MSAPIFKYLVVHPTDLGGGALGASSRVGTFTVDASLDRTVEYSDSTTIYAGTPLEDATEYGTGGLVFRVPVADDPAVVNGSGAMVAVSVSLTLRGETGKRSIPTKLVRVLAASVDLAADDPSNTLGGDVVYLSNLADQSPAVSGYGTPLPPSWGHGAPAGPAPDGFLYADVDTGNIYQYGA